MIMRRHARHGFGVVVLLAAATALARPQPLAGFPRARVAQGPSPAHDRSPSVIAQPVVLVLPDGKDGIGFDDLRFSPDARRGRAYTHTWDDATVVLELARHREVARWKNGCKASRGIALDEARGLLFVGCDEGKATALDAAHDGVLLGTAETGKGVDIIAYNPALAHLYVPGGDSATLTILGVTAAGKLDALGSVPVAADSHCVAADDAGHAYVCDPKRGALLIVTDPFPAER